MIKNLIGGVSTTLFFAIIGMSCAGVLLDANVVNHWIISVTR